MTNEDKDPAVQDEGPAIPEPTAAEEFIETHDLDELDPPAAEEFIETHDLDEIDSPAAGAEGNVSSPEARDRLLAATLAHAEAQDAQYRLTLLEERRPGRWKAPLALVVLALAGFIFIAPPAWLGGPTLQPVDADALERGAVSKLVLQAEQIRAFQVRHGRLPHTLDEVPVKLPGVRYVRSNNRVFQLVAPVPDGRTVVYDDVRPDPRFASAAAALLGGS